MFWFVMLLTAAFIAYRFATCGARSGAGNQPGPAAPGSIWEGSMASGVPVGRFGNGNIWEGPYGVGLPIARYEGESDGAAATAFVLKLVTRPGGLEMPVN